MKEKFAKTNVMFQGRAVGFRCDEVILPNGKRAPREYLTHPGAVAVLPLLDDPARIPLVRARVVMVRQYRYPVNQVTCELPAGKLDGKESLKACLERELKEETGYGRARFHKLLSFWPTPAFADEVIHIFWAEGLRKGKSRPDDDEFLSVVVKPYGEILDMIASGKIRDSKTIVGILAFAQFFGVKTGR